MPIHEDMSRRVAVADSVASRQEGPTFAEVDTEVREGFVLSSAVGRHSPHKHVDSARANGRSEGLNLAKLVRVLPESLLAERAQIVDSSVLIKVVLIEEFGWSLLEEICRSNRYLISVSLRRLRTRLWKSETLGQHVKRAALLLS